MGDSKDMRQNVSANLRSVTQSCKGGVPIETLERDYRDLVGNQIPYRNLGYSSLEAMLRAMPDVVTLQRNAAGRCVVMAVADESTAHISSLIARQKSATKKPSKFRRPIRVRRAPVAPAKTSSVRHFNRGTRALPSYSESQRSTSSSEQFYETTKVTRSASSSISGGDKILTPKPKVVTPPTFGSKYEVPPRFLRKQIERPLSSLENNSTEERFSSSYASNASNNVRRQAVESTVTSSSDEAPYFVPPPTYRAERAALRPESRSAREFIESYARKKNVEPPKYQTTLMGQKRRYFVSRITIEGKTYCSYPDHENLFTPEEAEEAAAEKARQYLIKAEGIQNALPVTSVSDSDGLDLMLTRIEEMVAEKPKGLWNTVIPSEYEEKFKEKLPEEWLSLVKQYCSFYFERVDESRIILYPSSDDSGRASPTSSCSTQEDENGLEDLERRISKLSVQLPILQLPSEDHFDVFVTNVQDALYVAVRLIDYAESFQELSDEMKSFYSQNKCPVTAVTTDKPYAVFVYNLWHRILVDEVKGNMVTCQLVDEGDLVEVDISKLQEMDNSFLRLPFQAVTFKLAELDCYSDFIKPETLRLYLLGKTLVAEVVDSDKTSIRLYDTSTEEDINLNRIIFEKTVAESLNYTLPEPGSSAMVYLSHIAPCGTVYLTFNSQLTTNLLLQELLRITPLCEETAKHGCDIEQKVIYCAKYIDDIWYRAVVIGSSIDKQEVEVLYVDYGNTSWVPITSICELKLVSEYLAGLPFQAVKCKLSELPPPNLHWGEKAINKLGELAAFDRELIVRVLKPGTEEFLPEVSLFIRNEQRQIISINQTLAYDEQLFSKHPSGEGDRMPAWTKTFFSEFNKKEYTPQVSSLYRSEVTSSPPLPPAENATSERKDNLSNFIPDVAVSAEQQRAKKHGNWSITCPPVGNECDSEDEQFPPLYPPDIPDEGNYFDIFITMAANPFNFMCQPLKSVKDLDQLFSEMQSFYSTEENLCDMHSILVKKEFFAGKHSDGSWYRVRKESIISEDPLQVSVFFVDYGDICILPLLSLQPLYKQFKSLPCQCMKASLKGVKPNGHDWMPLECIEFQKMVAEKQFVSIVESKQLKVEDHSTLYNLELFLTDVSDPDVDVLIHEQLIEKGLAQPAE